MSLIVLALDSEIELQKRKLERLGIVDDARDNEKKIRLNREKSYARRWMDENEKEMGWRGLISLYNRIKMKLLNHAILYIFVSNFYGQATILAVIAERTDRIPENAVPDTDIADKCGLSREQVYHYLRQLVGLGLVEIDQYVSGIKYRTIRITKEGLDASSSFMQQGWKFN